MKTIFTLLILSALAFAALGQSSGGSPGSHAANNGGFSQPPTMAPSTPANTSTAANPTTAGPDTVNPNINGSTPGITATNGTAPGFAISNGISAFGNTNGAAGWGTNNTFSPGAPAQIYNNGANPQNQAAVHMNKDGDITNANGTMTFNTNSPHWWEKKN